MNKFLCYVLFFCSILFFPVNGFPLGIALLREFGAAPTNFFLAGCLFPIISIVLQKKSIRVSGFRRFIVIILIFNILLWLNYFTMILLHNGGREVIGRMATVQWLTQYLMVSWMCLSLFIWLFILKRIDIFGDDYKYFIYILIISSIINVVFFVEDLVIILNGFKSDGTFLYSIQQFLGGTHDIARPGGITTEPSMFASWVMWIWPLLFFSSSTKLKYHYYLKVFSIVLLMLCIVSNARTFYAVFLAQVIIIFLVKLSKVNVKAVATILVVFFCLFSLFRETIIHQFQSFNVSKSSSSATRIGSSICAIKVFLDYPLTGIGLGQFTAYYNEYISTEIVNQSGEVSNFLKGGLEHRISTYNLPIRIACETGLITFTLYMFLLFLSFRWVTKKIIFQYCSVDMGIFLSMVGGISFWLQQDLIGYQPAILSLSIGIDRYLKNRIQQ